jgi:hypothetical protein
MKIFVVKNKQFIVSAKPPSKKKGKAKSSTFFVILSIQVITPEKGNLCFTTKFYHIINIVSI